MYAGLSSDARLGVDVDPDREWAGVMDRVSRGRDMEGRWPGAGGLCSNW